MNPLLHLPRLAAKPLRALAVLTALAGASAPAFAEIALLFGGNELVKANAPLVRMMGRGTLNTAATLSPSEGYNGPIFTGGYGRSNNGSVDVAEIRNNHGPYNMDMLGFTEGAMGTVDRIYGLISFPASSFSARFEGKPIRLARTDAFSIRTYTGFLPEQRGWVYFYIESNGQGFLSPAFSYTKDVDEAWGEKSITLSDPRSVQWTRFMTTGTSPELSGNRPPGTPDFDKVTAVGFYFETSATEGGKLTARFFTDFFLVNAQVD